MMNKYYSRFKKDNYDNRPYNQKENYYYKRNQYNKNYYYYPTYNKRKKKPYELYEEEISYDKETTISAKTPSTKEDSFSQSSNSNSRNQSYTEYNNDNIKNNKDNSFITCNNNKVEQLNIEDVPKINLSENELKSAYYKPKKFYDDPLKNNESNKKDKNENIVILEINVKISDDKIFCFKLRKYDDMFQVSKQVCKENDISEDYVNFFVYHIIKALNSIYGIYNMNLKEKEIEFLKDLKKKCIYV